MTPSFLGLIITGFLNLLAVILLIIHFTSINSVLLIQYVLLLCISIGIHSILHFQQEIERDFNPLEGKWIPTDNDNIKE
jgi:hypothetical protein